MAQRGDDPSYKYEKERSRIRDSSLSEPDRDALLEFLAACDPNNLEHTYRNGDGEPETLSYASLEQYGRNLRLIAKAMDTDLTTATQSELTATFQTFLDDLSKQTVRQRQAAAVKFYRYHALDVDPEEITLTKLENNGTHVDERDMFTRDEAMDLREACDNARDKALVDLLLYTGQRIRAIQTLRVKDVDPGEGVYWLNHSELGLKGSEGKRPLLGAKKAVREWLNYHPTGQPNDYLITPLPSATNTAGKGEYLSMSSIRNRLNTLADRAGVDKPPNPHNFRHYFVTAAKREFDMDDSTIKYLIGHAPESTVMETTYRHLTDEDHIQKAREKTGEIQPEQEGSLTPETCPTCDEPLRPGAKACEDCGTVFTPDAVAAKDQIEEDARQDKEEVEDLETYKLIDRLSQIKEDHPELVAKLLED